MDVIDDDDDFFFQFLRHFLKPFLPINSFYENVLKGC